MTDSANFPLTVGAYQSAHAADSGNRDAFVTRINAAGTALSYSTYLGGNSDDRGQAIAVDASGNAYVTGAEASTNFPTTAGAYKTANQGSFDAFVTKINPSLSGAASVVYSTYVGGNSDDYGQGIALDSSNNAYITGLANAASTTFPLVNLAIVPGTQSYDVFVSKLNATGTAQM